MKGQPEETIQKVFEELNNQRQSTLTNVEHLIDKEFNILLDKIEVLDQNMLQALNKFTLKSLLQNLKTLKETIETECSLLDTQIENILSEINTNIDCLSNLRYGTSWARRGQDDDVQDLVKEVMESIQKGKNLLKRKRTEVD